MKTILIWILTIAALLYISIGCLLYFFQEKLIFFPGRIPNDYQYNFNIPHEEIFYQTEENTRINVLKFIAQEPKGIVLFFHGNAGTLREWGFVAQDFVSRNFDLLILDYRTYGKSEGELNEAGLHHDASFIFKELLKTYKEDQIVVYGRSLGSGIAVQLAATNNPGALILETPFFNLADVAKRVAPIYPVQS